MDTIDFFSGQGKLEDLMLHITIQTLFANARIDAILKFGAKPENPDECNAYIKTQMRERLKAVPMAEEMRQLISGKIG